MFIKAEGKLAATCASVQHGGRANASEGLRSAFPLELEYEQWEILILIMKILIAIGLAGLLTTGCLNRSHPANRHAVEIVPVEHALRVSIDGEQFTDYIYEGLSRPALYPLLGPGQVAMTRHWPFEDVPGEDHDHPHHRSVWYEHGSLNHVDFWSEVPGAGKTVHIKFLKVHSGDGVGMIQSTNLLVSASNMPVASDVRTLRFYKIPHGKMFDYEVTTYASSGAITFGDTKEGTLGIRIAESMRLMRNKKPADGHIVLSTGARDNETWGKRAEWCDYYGPVQGKTVGIAIFDHPKNPRFPTWWHVRDYGLLAANPFGIHDFEKKPAGTGDLTVPSGQSITFRYRIYLHEGDEQQGMVAAKYAEWCRQP
jgi:hypothetical protein